MSVKTKLRPMTIEEYLDGEQRSNVRHELVGGQVYAMVGASNLHNLLAGTLYTLLRGHVKKPCQVFMSDMKVRVDDDFFYPDVVVACKHQTDVFYYVSEPVVIIEVLSPGTERQDRLEKRLAYQRLGPLQEYVLVAQDKIHVEVYRRTPDGWELEQFDDRDELRLMALDFTVPVVEIYKDVMDSV